MIIHFENVSYSYASSSTRKSRDESKRKAKKRQRELEKAQPADALSDGSFASPGVEADAHKWGNDPNQAWALRDVSFTLEDGEFLGIAGHTGSGKSTLLWTLAGLLKPTEGSATIDDGTGRLRKPSEERGTIGLVFQYPEHQLFAPTVLEDVCFGPRNLGLSEEEARERALSALARVGLDGKEVADRSPFQLSGGQQRRVALAGVLAMNPSVLALDEPAAGLDPQGRQELLALVKSLHEDGISCVMISHSMSTLARLSDRVLVMNEGRKVALDSPERVFRDAKRLTSIGLDVPPAASCAERLRAAGFPLKDTLYDEAHLIEDLIALGGAGKDEFAISDSSSASSNSEALPPHSITADASHE